MEDRRLLYGLTTGTGDGSLSVTVDGFGSFGSAIGIANNTAAIYDPIGPIGPASTTFQSGVAIRFAATGTRQFLTSGNLLGSGDLADPVVTGTPTSGNSSFTFGGLDFELLQAASPLFDDSGVQTGSIMTQRYAITNAGSATVAFELVRYIDGDLLFDGTLVDGGGRLISAGREFLFETDAGGTGGTDTTFLGIDATGGTLPSTNRYEVDSFSGLGTRIIAGNPLDDLITGDNDGDGFIEAGQEYDVTLALRNTFTLAPGASTTYSTRTAFGSGNPEDIPIDPLIELGPDVMQLEGDAGLTAFVFTVSLAEETSSTVIVDYTTVDGTAVAPGDYQAQSGTLTFEFGGPTTQSITINVVGDELIEENETFLLRLSSSSGGILDDIESVGTILNDDIALSIDDITVLEGNAGTKDAVFTLSAAGGVNSNVGVSYSTINGTALAGSDYLARAGFATLPRGASSARITVPIVGDRFNEATETFSVALFGATGARIDRALGTATVLDNDPLPNLYVSDVQITAAAPGVHEAMFTVALDAPSGREVVVEYATADGVAIAGTDYEGQRGDLTFLPGMINRAVSVPVFTDDVYTANRHFSLNLSSPNNALMLDSLGIATIVYADELLGESIVDNRDSGYSHSGNWTNLTNTLAYGLDYDYHAAGNGSAVATWSFDDIPDGSYQVFARWSWFSNRATNAPYTILDGANPLGTVLVNQQVAPVGDFSEGISWQSLGNYQIDSGNLVVQLANNANGIVIADAVRIVAGGIGPQSPEMDVAGFDRPIDRGDVTPSLFDATDFGQVPRLTDSLIHTFTISNNGNADLHLSGSPPLTISGTHAADFWVVSQPSNAISPTGETTFQLMFHPSATGLRTATVSIANDDDSEHPYTFAVQGTGTGNQQSLFVVDEASPNFSQAGNWTASADSRAHQGQMLHSVLGQGSDVAVWDFSGLPADTYDVYATWVPAADRSTAAEFVVSNLTDHTFTSTVNQRLAPAISMNSSNWTNLGQLDVNGGSLRVRLSGGGKGVVVADAVMVVRGGNGTPAVPYSQNAALPQDVNTDGRVSPVDVLVVINNLLMQNMLAGAPPTAAPATAAAPQFISPRAAVAEGTVSNYLVDVNGDGRVSPIDVLMVINHLLGSQLAAPSTAPLVATSGDTDSALVAVAVDQAIPLVDESAEAAADASAPGVEFAVVDETTSDTEALADLLFEPAGVDSLLSADDEDSADGDEALDALFAGLGD